MPSVISHAVIGVATSIGFKSAHGFTKLLVLSIVCSIIGDADVLGYRWLDIPSHSFFGHRGFFHSFFFAALFSILIVFVFYRKELNSWKYLIYFFILTSTHGILDALTNGGQGIALFSPFSNHRYFFPWNPIEVSPLSIKTFLGPRGLTVLKNEIVWIWIPSFFIVIFQKIHGNMRRKVKK